LEFEIYCDESRQDYFWSGVRGGERYVLIGGLWIEACERQDHKERIKHLRDMHGVQGEFKWNRVAPSRQEFYLALVRLFFRESMRFRCIVLPAHQLDCVRFHDSDSELMFYKFYYQLLHHWILDFNSYRIFVDLKSNRVGSRIRTLERVLRNTNLTAEIRSVQALPSSQLDLLQLADVLIGAVGASFHRETTSNAKRAVMDEIEAHLGHPIGATALREPKFNVFRFRPGGGW
jgi:hypothetical protein